MNFDGYKCKPEKNINIEEILIRAMNAYFRQNPDQVYLAIVIVKGDEASFTVL
jgi:hypothetical protein